MARAREVTGDRRDALLPVGASTAALAALWIAIRVGTGFDGLYGQDSHAYLAAGATIRAWLLGGGPLVLSLHSWPPNFPAAIAMASFVVPLPLAAQLLGLLALLLAHVGGCATMLLARPDDGPRIVAYWTVAFGLSPYLFRSAFGIMTDVPGLALFLIGVAAAERFEATGGAIALLAAAAALGAAGGTRQPMAIFALPVAVLLGWRAARKGSWGSAIAAAALGIVLLHPAYVIDGAPRHTAVTGWAVANAWSRTLTSTDGTTTHGIPTALFATSTFWHPGYWLLTPLLLTRMRRADLAGGLPRALAAGLVMFTLFAAGLPYQNPRHLLPAFPVVLLLLGPAARRAMDAARGRRLVVVLALLAAFNIALLPRALRAMLASNAFERQMAEGLRHEPATTLYTFALTPALATRGVPQHLVDLFDGPVAGAQPGDLVLFAPARFRAQWDRTVVMENWRRLEALGLVPRRELGEGFTLYEVEGRQPR